MSSVFRVRTMSWIVAFVLVLLPFHAFFTTWIGSNTGHLDLVRIWKEIIITALVVISTIMVWRDGLTRQKLLRLPLLWLIIAFSVIELLWGLVAHHQGKVSSVALIYGLIINLRYFWFFLVCIVVSSRDQFLADNWAKILLIPAGIVVVFGVFQKVLLPYDFLKHFGYGEKTIPAYQTVDSSLDYRRIQSTLRGANPLGAYLIPVIVGLVLRLKKQKRLAKVALVFSAITLFYTYSRSAWMGLLAALLTLTYLSLRGRKFKVILVASVGILTLAGASLSLVKSTSLQDTLFHTSSSSKSAQSSNAQRLTAEKAALKDVYHHPLGQGTGTAGPASFRNSHPAKIAENYYLQIAQEVGILGLILWIAVVLSTLGYLLRGSSSPLNQLLIASLVGISLVNLLSHAWTDDTISLLWWGLAGVACGPAILGLKHERVSKT